MTSPTPDGLSAAAREAPRGPEPPRAGLRAGPARGPGAGPGLPRTQPQPRV